MDLNELTPTEESLLEALEQAWLCSDDYHRDLALEEQAWWEACIESIPDHCGTNR